MPVAFFRIAVLWDSPFVPTAYMRHNLSCLEPAWTEAMGRGWNHAPSSERTPEQGAVLLTLALPGLDADAARALALGSATAMGAIDTHGRIGWSDRAICVGAWEETLRDGLLFHQDLLPWMRRGHMPPALLVHIASADEAAQADGTLRIEAGHVVGTGVVAGRWDASTFFLPSPLARAVRTSPDGVDSRAGHLQHLLAVGGVALGTGLVLGWMARTGQDVLALPSLPIEGVDAALAPLLAACFGVHRTEAPEPLFDMDTLQETPVGRYGDGRRTAFTAVSSSWRLLTRMGGAKSRAELAEDIAFFLPRALWTMAVWQAQGPIGSSTLIACPYATAHLRQAARKMGMGPAFDSGFALGQAHGPHDPTLLPALRADGWV